MYLFPHVHSLPDFQPEYYKPPGNLRYNGSSRPTPHNFSGSHLQIFLYISFWTSLPFYKPCPAFYFQKSRLICLSCFHSLQTLNISLTLNRKTDFYLRVTIPYDKCRILLFSWLKPFALHISATHSVFGPMISIGPSVSKVSGSL